MIRRPPRSTLFPTRRSSDLASDYWDEQNLQMPDLPKFPDVLPLHGSHAAYAEYRSEEHTSELQSHSDLVCRLLLEKKKKKKKRSQNKDMKTRTALSCATPTQ